MASADSGTGRIDFNEHIRPILNENCVICHGGVKAASEISFVYRESATGEGESGKRPIVPGDPEASELIARVTSDDPDYRMPEADHASPLAKEEIALLRQWIEEGAEWKEHWAYVAPVRPPLPEVAGKDWARRPVDAFVLARLEAEGLSPSSETDEAALLRRVSFDLTGLPPTMEELDTFLNDEAPDAFERQVDRLLASPHFGERWAASWLDLARYADSKGYEKDTERHIWPWRDWVVNAFNANQPYDEFLIDQLAGDLRENANLDQRIATAFHRNTSANDEGGTDDEEFRIAALIDRVSTTWAAFNATTFGCAQCHAHPYDPIRHEEFYKFAAFFNNTADSDYHMEYPVLRVPVDPELKEGAEKLDEELARLRRDLAAENRAAEAGAAWKPLAIAGASSPEHEVKFELRDGEAFIPGTVATAAEYDLFSAPASEDGTVTAIRIQVPPENEAATAHTPGRGFIVTQVRAWIVEADGSERPIRFSRWAHDAERMWMFSTLNPKPPEIADDPDEAMAWRGGFAANPTLTRTRWLVGALGEALEIPAGARLKVRLSHGRQITEKPAPVRRVRLATNGEPAWVSFAVDAGGAARIARIEAIEKELAAIDGIDVPIMAELPVPDRREMRLYERGNFLNKVGAPLEPDVPELFPPLPEGAPHNRLGLAKWLVSPEHPLTARVAVNRFWQQLFGTGIVETTEDFGGVGAEPSHPRLLDWLAVHFQQDLGWDMKAMLREIVTSATYRQDSRVVPRLLEKDPANRLLARGPRSRLSAEMVRDQALLASGLLNAEIGGPPVMPPQPEGVWSVAYGQGEWVNAEGANRYRRAIYTYMRRSALYPSFVTFDAANRNVCVTRRIPTNTPLQALVTLNDPVYHETSVALAGRMVRKIAAGDVGPGIAYGMRLVTSQHPAGAALKRLSDLYHETRGLYQNDAGLLAELGTATADDAALVAVASAILNLDEALTK